MGIGIKKPSETILDNFLKTFGHFIANLSNGKTISLFSYILNRISIFLSNPNQILQLE